MITTRVKVVNVLLQIVVFQFFFQGCSSNKPILIDVRPVSLTESKDKINFNVVFAYADDLEQFSFYHKSWPTVKGSESVYIDKLLYDSDIQKERRPYRYPCETSTKVAKVGNILRRNAEAVFKSIFNNATTLHIPGDDHFTGLIIDRQQYKEIVPPNTVGIIKLRSPEVRFYVEFKKPPGTFDQPNEIAELTAEWVLEDLEGNEIWSGKIVGSGLNYPGVKLTYSFKSLIQEPFQPAVDEHFRNLARAIETSPEIRLFESCLQINRDRLLADPSSAHDILNRIENTQERRRVANKLVYLAIEKDSVALLKELLSTTFTDVNLADKYYQRLLIHLAVQKNNFEAVKLLIANHSAVDIADNSGFTPLHYAASSGHTQIADLLIQNGVDVNARNADGQTPFMLAVANGHKRDWQLLLDGGANPHAINEEDVLWTAELYNEIGLHFAEKNDKSKSTEAFKTAADYFEKASKLYNRVSKKAETKAFFKDLFEITLLTVHAWGSQWQAQQRAKQYAEFKALNDAREMGLSQTQTLTLIRDYKSNALNSDVTLAAGNSTLPSNRFRTADPKRIAKYYSQLAEICHNSSNEVQSILKCYEERGAQFKECIPDDVRVPRKSSKDSELVQAAKDGNVQTVQSLISKSGSVDAKDENGAPAIVWAANNGHTDVVKLLLKNGADIIATLNDGRTALWQASNNGHTSVVKILLEKGADVNSARASNNVTALFQASWKGHTDVVRLLLDKGADLGVRGTTDGVTALWIASQEGHVDVVRLLLDKGADVNVKRNSDGVTALWQASNNGHVDVVKILIENGADVDVKRLEDGVTALWQASWKGYVQIVKLLLDKGADVHVERTTNGFTALSVASHGGHTEIVDMLLAKGADVNATNNAGRTPLDLAEENGHREVVALLKQQGAKRSQDLE